MAENKHKYKIGDELICLPGFNTQDYCNDRTKGAGAGYQEGRKAL